MICLVPVWGACRRWAIAFCGTLVVCAAGASSASAVCWPSAPSGWTSAPILPSDQFIVQGPKVYLKDLEDAAEEIRSQDFFGTYEQKLNIPRLGYPGQTGKLPIYIDPLLPNEVPNADGYNTQLCNSPNTNVIVVDPATASNKDTFHATLAHELFHAAQAELGGHFKDNWWYEATATWAETQFGYQDARSYSTTVTGHPDLPIDSFAPAVDGAKQHEYGAWTFVAWLFSRHKINWSRMRESFMQAAQTDATPVIDNLLQDVNSDVGDEVASYWADHTNVLPQFGPTAKMTSAKASDWTENDVFPAANPLAARVVKIHPTATVRQLVVIVHKLGAGEQAWIRTDKDQYWRIESGDSFNEAFCRTGATAGSLPFPDTGDVRIAITSLNKKANAEIKIKLIGSKDACPKQLIIQPGLAMGELHLGMTIAEAEAAAPRHHLFHGVPTPLGEWRPGAFNVHDALVIAEFLDGRIAALFTESFRARTTTGIRILEFQLPHYPAGSDDSDRPIIIPGSTMSEFGGGHCHTLENKNPPTMFCRREGPSSRYTLALAGQFDPCPTDARPDDHDDDVDTPPCSYPKDFYVGGIAVATKKGLTLLEHLGLLFKLGS
jgi:hypothetical protein